MALAFGPEGGWTEVEVEMFKAAGWKSASLGHTILRAETAAIAALAVAVCEVQ
ncbi:MAG: RsmE family RNA methyltransferase [Candidatus Angelobacter sp.]